eukprot:m.211052 g.211052  ORF g.211052 m.211052 type:complete len:154 (-) comp15490_c0_seq6:9454-9915(-)
MWTILTTFLSRCQNIKSTPKRTLRRTQADPLPVPSAKGRLKLGRWHVVSLAPMLSTTLAFWSGLSGNPPAQRVGLTCARTIKLERPVFGSNTHQFWFVSSSPLFFCDQSCIGNRTCLCGTDLKFTFNPNKAPSDILNHVNVNKTLSDTGWSSS